MIVVTGTPRSGSSLMMQTLKLLGVPIVGTKFSYRNKVECNVKGYWELDDHSLDNGIPDDRYKGKAIKCFATELSKTKPALLDKVIVCERYINHRAKSLVKYFKVNPDLRLKPTRGNAQTLLENWDTILNAYLEVNSVKYLKVSYLDMLNKTRNTIEKIRNYLGLDVDINDAVYNVGV